MTSSNGSVFCITGHLCGEFPVNSPHKGQWRGTLIFSLICPWINGWVNNRKADDLRRNCAHFEVIVMGCDLRHWTYNCFMTWRNCDLLTESIEDYQPPAFAILLLLRVPRGGISLFLWSGTFCLSLIIGQPTYQATHSDAISTPMIQARG